MLSHDHGDFEMSKLHVKPWVDMDLADHHPDISTEADLELALEQLLTLNKLNNQSHILCSFDKLTKYHIFSKYSNQV